jgi:excisionase family DNA binding protein
VTRLVDVGDEALDLLTVKEVATRLRFSVVTIRRLIAAGDLEGVHVGASVRVAPEAVAEYKARLRAAAQGKPAVA